MHGSTRSARSGSEGPATPTTCRAETRRPGVAWSTFVELEPLLDADQAGALWAAMAKVYPELQDWVARRGHGGAAPFQSAVVELRDQATACRRCRLVIVEIHGGFQFSDVASEFADRAAHAAIDAGADLVVGHHPHVLQGFEWYKGHLIAYSLGNFVFDQDFLSTFPSVIMRTIFEGTRLDRRACHPAGASIGTSRSRSEARPRPGSSGWSTPGLRSRRTATGSSPESSGRSSIRTCRQRRHLRDGNDR